MTLTPSDARSWYIQTPDRVPLLGFESCSTGQWCARPPRLAPATGHCNWNQTGTQGVKVPYQWGWCAAFSAVGRRPSCGHVLTPLGVSGS